MHILNRVGFFFSYLTEPVSSIFVSWGFILLLLFFFEFVVVRRGLPLFGLLPKSVPNWGFIIVFRFLIVARRTHFGTPGDARPHPRPMDAPWHDGGSPFDGWVTVGPAQAETFF